MCELQVNVAYRWFLDLGLTDKVPDASKVSENRRRRFAGIDIEQMIFDENVRQALSVGLIGGPALLTDSAHLKASANKRRHQVNEMEQTPLSSRNIPPVRKATKISDIDPDAGYVMRDQKP